MPFRLVATLALPISALGEPSARPLIKDFIGINGHTVQFKPDLYQPTCSLVRDYHPVSWDLDKATQTPAPFPFAKNRVDWSKVYGSWQRSGWTTNACLMFESIPIDQWNDLEKDARRYGENFARQFGPSGDRKLVQSVEIGNEPGKWTDADYARIFRAMATGLRAGDPQLKIGTCNLTTGKSGDYEKSVTCLKGLEDFVDVLTIHTYAQLTGWPTWKRSFPEDPALPRYLKDVENLIAWRDEHMKDTPIWITEFGYDSSTKPNEKSGTFAKWEGVTDTQQAQWIVRSLLLFSAMPVERAYIYFFNDSDKPSLHASAGLTRNFKPKPSFHAVAHLQETLGDYRFEKTVTSEPGKLFIHQYQHATDPKKTTWAVWSPTGTNQIHKATLKNLPGKLTGSSVMPLTDQPAATARINSSDDHSLIPEVSESPAFLHFAR